MLQTSTIITLTLIKALGQQLLGQGVVIVASKPELKY